MILPRNLQEAFFLYALQWLGKPYRWGGDDPSGFDCSGFVIECCKAFGLLPSKGDWTANTLWHMWEDKRLSLSDEVPVPGDIIFYGKNDYATHVEIIFYQGSSIGSSGGGSKTLTEADAWKHNAYIKVRPFDRRGDILGIVRILK